jgi:hypothetical protein
VNQDEDKARRLLTEAAKLGHGLAAERLVEMDSVRRGR